jgi:hypothetical protein
MIIPVSPAIYCFVVEEKEVIHEGELQTTRRWGCGYDRSQMAEEAQRVGKEVKTWGRPIKPKEVAT